jgi:hypothetical protein
VVQQLAEGVGLVSQAIRLAGGVAVKASDFSSVLL